jgi:hypothetical protein
MDAQMRRDVAYLRYYLSFCLEEIKKKTAKGVRTAVTLFVCIQGVSA